MPWRHGYGQAGFKQQHNRRHADPVMKKGAPAARKIKGKFHALFRLSWGKNRAPVEFERLVKVCVAHFWARAGKKRIFQAPLPGLRHKFQGAILHFLAQGSHFGGLGHPGGNIFDKPVKGAILERMTACPFMREKRAQG